MLYACCHSQQEDCAKEMIQFKHPGRSEQHITKQRNVRGSHQLRYNITTVHSINLW
jgi:hypothetical protein